MKVIQNKPSMVAPGDRPGVILLKNRAYGPCARLVAPLP